MRGSRGGQGVRTPPPWKITKYRVSSQYWPGSPEKSQSYQPSIQCWASICPPPKRHFNSVLLADQWWPIYSDIWILYPPSTKTKNTKKKRCQSWTPSDRTFRLDPRMVLHVANVANVLFNKGMTYTLIRLCTFDVCVQQIQAKGFL